MDYLNVAGMLVYDRQYMANKVPIYIYYTYCFFSFKYTLVTADI